MRHLTGITWLPVFFTLVFMAFFFPFFFTLSEAADAPNNGGGKTGKHRVVIVTDPYKSMVEILDSSVAYTPGVALPDGKYKIKVSHVGYVSETGSIVVDGRDVSALVVLKELPTPEGVDSLLEVKQTLNEAVAQLEREKRAVEREKQKIAEDWRQIQAARQNLASGGPSPLAHERVGGDGSDQAEKFPDIGTMVLVENHDFVDLTPMEETVAQPSRQEALVLLPVQDVKTEVSAPKAPPSQDAVDPPKGFRYDGHFKHGDVYAHTEKLRMRRAAHLNAEVVKELPLNTRLRVLDAKNGWLHVVSPDDDDGWVAEFLVRNHLSGRRETAPVGAALSPVPSTDAVPSTTVGGVSTDRPNSEVAPLSQSAGKVDSSADYDEVYVHGDNVRLRRAGRSDSMVVKELASNTRLRVVDVVDGWVHVIDPDNVTGWVAAFLVGNHSREKPSDVSEKSTPSSTGGAVADQGEVTEEASQWYVQTSFYWDLKSAEDEVSLLKDKGFKALAVNKKFPSGKDGFFVRMGGFDGRAEALSAMDRFHDQFGKEGMLVKPKQ
ncbi:MAG: SH3 domain-containing protein [Magnetococcus sp. THC-1_WYH]